MTVTADSIRAGNPRAIARAATLIENRQPGAEQLLRDLFPHTGRALVIGVTGAPGAGKSTVCDAMIRQLRAAGRTVGVIAVDPTSPYTGGAILGDRIRMQDHHADEGVFIRSMATRGQLGGIAAATMDLALLLDAAGRDVIFVETVGVGQDEVEIARLAGVTAVVLVPGMGDDVQAIKAGIMEIADVFIINKSDQPGADRLEREIQAMLGLAHGVRQVPIVKTVAKDGTGIAEALAAIESVTPSKARQVEMWTGRLREMLRARLLERYPAALFGDAAEAVARREKDPYSLVAEWLKSQSII